MNSHLRYLSIAEFQSAITIKKKDIADNFIQGLREYGFAIIKDTIFNSELESSLYSEADSFFSSSNVIKDRYYFPDIFGQRGYTKPLVETAQGSEIPDLKEFYQYGRPPKASYTKELGYYENPSLVDFPDFELKMKKIYNVLNTVSMQVLEVISLGLGINFEFFQTYTDYGNSIMRILNYFSYNDLKLISNDSFYDLPKWAEAHTDINLITLLIGSTQQGLQIYSENRWLDYVAKPGELAMNVGDMLSLMTGNYLPSTMHRVICPNDFYGSRLSAPFFLHPSYNMPLGVHSDLKEKFHIQSFDSILAGDFLNQRLIEIGLKN
ncbi:isopenicillin N synthase family oxygenase [bacterium]|jgi:isopenicillin N synthase-like dioxygenase|nr:isopenicillin N synthase family oxygenase [bacterium]MBT6293585.1 isopenicillin N synthase family oxygenase [bacterium]